MDSPASPTAEIKRTPTILQMEALRMRRRLACDGPGVLRALGAAGKASRSMRRFPGRQQGQQRAEGCATVRADGQGISEGAGDAASSCRCLGSSTGTSTISWCWKASMAITPMSTIPRSGVGRSATRSSTPPSPASYWRWSPRPNSCRAGASRPDCAAAAGARRRARGLLVASQLGVVVVPTILAAEFRQNICRRHSDPTCEGGYALADRHGFTAVVRALMTRCNSHCCCGSRPSSR